MSRFGDGDYDDYDGRANLWVANVRRVLAGKRGKAILAEVEQVLLAMPKHRLIAGALAADGDVCLVGAYACYRDAAKTGKAWADVVAEYAASEITEEWSTVDVGVEQGLGRVLAYELAYRNDEHWELDTPEQRWEHALSWVQGILGRWREGNDGGNEVGSGASETGSGVA